MSKKITLKKVSVLLTVCIIMAGCSGKSSSSSSDGGSLSNSNHSYQDNLYNTTEKITDIEETIIEINTVEETIAEAAIVEEATKTISENNSGSVTLHKETSAENSFSNSSNSMSTSNKRVTIGFFTFSNISFEDDVTESDPKFGHTHEITLTAKNTSNSSWNLFANDFYLKDTNGEFYNFSSSNFSFIDKQFRASESRKISMLCNFFHYPSLKGCSLYYDDELICTF